MRIKQRFIHVLTNSRLICRAVLAFKRLVYIFHLASSSFLFSAALNLAPNAPFDLLKSFLLLRTYPFSDSPFLSLCVRHKKVSHSDSAVGSVRWFRGKGSWQTGSFLTTRADIISGVLDWTPNDLPKNKTIASMCPLSYYYPSHCLRKRSTAGYHDKKRFSIQSKVYIFSFHNSSQPKQQTCLKVFKYQNSNAKGTKQVFFSKAGFQPHHIIQNS